jgi:hypothetical protein
MAYRCEKNKPIWNPDLWNNLENVDIINCYSYAFNYIENNLEKKLQPGELSNEKFKSYDCFEIEDKIKNDYGINYLNKLNSKDDIIPCNHYKIALVIDNNSKDKDYHFYREDLNGFWSHKTGKDQISNKDASGNLIKDPHNADRNYKDLEDDDDNNYNFFCSYYSIPFHEPMERYNNLQIKQ